MNNPCRILIADVYTLDALGTQSVLEKEKELCVAGTLNDLCSLADTIQEVRPDMLVLEIQVIRGRSGLESLKDIRSVHPDLPVLVFSRCDETMFAIRAIKAGAMGYVMKSECPAVLLSALHKVLEGQIFLSEGVSQRLAQETRGDASGLTSPDVLSDRAFEVFSNFGRGLSTKEVAETLHLSVKTIESYTQIIKKRLGYRNKSDLVRAAIQFEAGQGSR